VQAEIIASLGVTEIVHFDPCLFSFLVILLGASFPRTGFCIPSCVQLLKRTLAALLFDIKQFQHALAHSFADQIVSFGITVPVIRLS